MFFVSKIQKLITISASLSFYHRSNITKITNNFTVETDWCPNPSHSIQSQPTAIPDIEVGQVLQESDQNTQGFVWDGTVIDGESLQCTVRVTDIQDAVVRYFITKLSTETQLFQGLFPKENVWFNPEWQTVSLPKTGQAHISHVGVPQIKFLYSFEAEP